MAKKIVLGIAIALALFLCFVSTRDGHFRYERSGLINAPADKIFPMISSFKKCEKWNPYDQKDPNMKRTYSGPDGQVGSTMDFDGNSEAGAGRLEILKVVPNQEVELKLTMTKPFPAENRVQYRLTPEGTGTRFVWMMSGDSGFMGKLISVFINCEKMVTQDFESGISNLKKQAELAQ